MQVQPILIDVVLPQDEFAMQTTAVLELEWFEVHKKRLTRSTSAGQHVLLQLDKGKEWRVGDGLFYAGQLVAKIVIKPTLTIGFNPINAVQVADFSYYIGNRHLPLFIEEDLHRYRVPYDGRLYEQLHAKYNSQIQLEDGLLLSENLVRQRIKKSKNENE